MSTLISYAERIGYVDLPLYYYIIRDDSGVNDLRSDRLLHCLEAYKIAIEHCKSDMRQELVASIAHRVCYDLRAARWTFADKYIEYIKENEELFDIPQVKKDTRTYQQLERIYQLGSGTIPQKVYLNAFHGKSPRNRQEIQDYAFYKTTEVLCLDESNCDVGKLPVIQQAYENGDDELVAQYFALEKIYESGGVYLSACIEIINTFNCLKYCEAFVGYLDDTTFTDKVFGGKARSKLVEGRLKTYRFGGLYEKPEYTPVSYTHLKAARD